MLCRVALLSDESSQPVYLKVQDLFVELFGRLSRMEPKFEGLKPILPTEDIESARSEKELQVYQANVID